MRGFVFVIGVIATAIGLAFLVSALCAPFVVRDSFGPNYVLAHWSAACSVALFMFALVCFTVERRER